MGGISRYVLGRQSMDMVRVLAILRISLRWRWDGRGGVHDIVVWQESGQGVMNETLVYTR